MRIAPTGLLAEKLKQHGKGKMLAGVEVDDARLAHFITEAHRPQFRHLTEEEREMFAVWCALFHPPLKVKGAKAAEVSAVPVPAVAARVEPIGVAREQEALPTDQGPVLEALSTLRAELAALPKTECRFVPQPPTECKYREPKPVVCKFDPAVLPRLEPCRFQEAQAPECKYQPGPTANCKWQPQGRSIAAWVWRAVVLLLLLLLAFRGLRAQAPHDPIILRGQQGGVTQWTRQAGLVQLNCGTNVTCNWAANTWTTNVVGAPPTGPAGGALTGFYPNPTLANVPNASVLPRVFAAGVLGPSGLSDDLTNIYDTGARNWGIGTWDRTGNTAPARRLEIWGGDVTIADDTDLAAESLQSGNFANCAVWTTTGDFTCAAGVVTYVHNTGVGTLRQTNANMTIAMVNSRFYRLVGTLSAVTAGPVCTLPTVAGPLVTADATYAVGVDTTAGVAKNMLKFKSNAASTGFQISCTSAAGGFTLDDLSLRQATGGDLAVYGTITGGGTSGLKVDSSGNVGIKTVPVTGYGLIIGSGVLDVVEGSIYGTVFRDRTTLTYGLFPSVSDALTATTAYHLLTRHASTGIPAAGFGSGWKVNLETATASTYEDAGTVELVWTDATAGSTDSKWVFYRNVNSVLTEAVEIGGTYALNVTGAAYTTSNIYTEGHLAIYNIARIETGGATGRVMLRNYGQTEFDRLMFGGNTNSFNAIARDAVNGFSLQSAAGTATWNDASTGGGGTVPNRYLWGIGTPTLSATNVNVTYTVASSFYIGGAPAAGANVTITTPYALNVAAGNSYFGGATVYAGTTFAALGAPANGTIIYCSDCTIASPCAAAGTGALAKRLNAVWVCN